MDEETPDQLHDRVAVRIFTLCDHATVPPDGKIYIHGAGVHQLFVPQIPGPLRTLFLVVRLSIPWHMLGEPHIVLIRALDLDRRPLGPNDPLITTPFELEVGADRARGFDKRAGGGCAIAVAVPGQADDSWWHVSPQAEAARVAVVQIDRQARNDRRSHASADQPLDGAIVIRAKDHPR